jgi:hypothetical protein
LTSKPRRPTSYADAVTQAQELLRQGRLADEGEHFPYKRDEMDALIAENPPMGPDGPDDDRFRASDYTSSDIAAASERYIAAQERYLKDPGDATRGEYADARDELVEARRAHRSSRAGVYIGGVWRAPRAGE